MRRTRTVAVGQTYGRWAVLAFSHKNARGELHWSCRCECGTRREVKGGSLLRGVSKSCGCLWYEIVSPHGMTGTPTFKSWESMLQRCYNENAPDYPRYGGRGIRVCPQWKASFITFFEEMGERPEETSLDRIDNAKGYSAQNCRWATRSEQQRNKDNSHNVTFNGKTQALIDWARDTGIAYGVLLRRRYAGWSDADLFKPTRAKAPNGSGRKRK